MRKTFVPLLLLTLSITASLAPPAEARRPNQPSDDQAGVFDYYLLALSWSPTFCLTRANNEQCRGKGYGFVLHGLWPQFESGGWPQFCAGSAPLSPAERAQGRTLFVTPKLMDHEWKKHGTCTGLGAAGYFAKSDQALAAVKIPPELEPSTNAHSLPARQIVELFQHSNPQLPSEAINLRCSGPELAEVWVCMTKDLQFKACDSRVRSNCRSGDLRIPAVR